MKEEQLQKTDQWNLRTWVGSFFERYTETKYCDDHFEYPITEEHNLYVETCTVW